MRRLIACLAAFMAMTASLLVLPVYAAPTPDPEPVQTSTETVALGSVAQPEGEAEVRLGTSSPSVSVPVSTPVLTVRQVDVPSFSLVGVTWAESDAVTDTVARVRVQRAGGGWGSWAEVGVEDAEQDGAAGRGGTAPLWTGPSTGVEVELVTRSGAAPADVQLDLVDPGESNADAGLSSPAIQDTADAATDMPDVFSRAQWGADEALRTWAPQYAPTIRAATVHHTADNNGYTVADVPAMMRSIYRYHAVSRGWGDIGYNVVVDRFGRLWEGRSGGLASTVVGAHAGGFNSGTFGVSMLGNFDVAPAPQAMVDAVAAIIAWKFSLYGVDPAGMVTLTSGGGGTSRYAAGERVSLPTIFGHRDVGNTSCPGRYGYARLGEIRAAVAARLTSREYEMQAAVNRAGGAAVLGAIRGALVTDGPVSWQAYDNGRVYWAPGNGAHALTGTWLQTFLDAGGHTALGAPRSDVQTSVRSGQVLLLVRGAITRTPTGPLRVVAGQTYERWIALGAENGWLGYPSSAEAVLAGGGFTAFEGGSVYRSPGTGAHAVRGGIYEAWARLGYETGVLGFPTADEVPVAGGFVSTFQGGSIFWSPSTGGRFVRGGIQQAWVRLGGVSGVLGFPTADEVPVAGGFVSTFQGGSIFWSPSTGGRFVRGGIQQAWVRLGGVSGVLGFPTADEVPVAGGFVSTFQGGSIFWSPSTGGHPVQGDLLAAYVRQGGPAGALGFPVSDPQARSGGLLSTFQRGSIAWSPRTGARVLDETFSAAYDARGGVTGPLGFPTTDVFTAGGAGRGLHTEGGNLYWSPSTQAANVSGRIYQLFAQQGYEYGPLGYPLGDAEQVAGGLRQRFQRGEVFSSALGTFSVTGGLAQAYARAGGAEGPLGLPGTPARTTAARGGGWYQHFQGGSVYWSPMTGGHPLRGAVLSAWAASGYEYGALGFPTTDPVVLNGGGFTGFQGGAVYWSTGHGAHVLSGAFYDEWARRGYETGQLGYPTSDVYAVAGGSRMDFAGGHVLRRNDGSVMTTVR
ncbi:N-acetylmuramoyl-L-alanine amidase [Klenkia taihuensis]|uniref:Uncharacterized conserved protein, contains LGFP repeats n=1 Tax=Klenkia taihuensis TaxID=1225127 RepID=A0A1I1JXK6_9ACTN|nr:N-acetylmuramoyl-L-alanine amidase [Klenkia taihuensis]SFC53397.1 Uncharacterized conserved protein, contains LGFP repeats [Klenkia taihuensis]